MCIRDSPNGGVGLARLEFIINNNIGIHPKAVLDLSLIHILYRGVPVCGTWRMAAQRRRDTTVGAIAPPLADAGKRLGRRHAALALAAPTDLIHYAGIHRKMELDIKGIMERLPHRYPMLLIDLSLIHIS